MNIWGDFNKPPLLKIERVAVSIFGAKQYGAHINGYVSNINGYPTAIWLGVRSKNKSTHPGKYDQIAAGAMSANDMSARSCAEREAFEEAGLTSEYTQKLKPVGAVSYIHEDKRGIFPEVQFVFDLDLPKEFNPVNVDGEVGLFVLVSIDQAKLILKTDTIKYNSALVLLDFFIRHGFINADEETQYITIVNQIHRGLF